MRSENCIKAPKETELIDGIKMKAGVWINPNLFCALFNNCRCLMCYIKLSDFSYNCFLPPTSSEAH